MILNVQNETCKACEQKKCNGCKILEEESEKFIIQKDGTVTLNNGISITGDGNYFINPGYVYSPYIPIITTDNYQKSYSFQPQEDINIQQLARTLKTIINISQSEFNRLSQDVKRHFKQKVIDPIVFTYQ